MSQRVRNRKLLTDYGLTILIAVAVALSIRFYLIEAFRIPTPAMVPTLEPGDTIFVSKWPYSLRKQEMPRAGEIVVFSPPPQNGEPKLSYIKRVVGLPGDSVEVTSGVVSINGRSLATESEPARRGEFTCFEEKIGERKYGVCFSKPLIEDFPRQIVPQGSVFVIGDLRSPPRNEVRDLRKAKSWGIVPAGAIKGKAAWIWLSVQPREIGEPARLFPKLRWSRMFRRIQ